MNGNYYPAKPSTEDKRILLVEDDPNFGTVLKDYLVMSGFDVTLAKNGMEGFELFLSFSLPLALCVKMLSKDTNQVATTTSTNLLIPKFS